MFKQSWNLQVHNTFSNSSSKIFKKNKIRVINSCGEWNEQRDFFEEHDVELIDLGFDYFKYLPKLGFLEVDFHI